MKFYRLINIILISAWVLLHLGHFVLNIANWKDKTRRYNSPINQLKPIDPPISKDLSYNQYKELEVQQRIARSLKNGEPGAATPYHIGIVGIGASVMLCDTCTIKGPIEFMPNEPKYYFLSLRGWKLKSTTSAVPTLDSVIFHVEKGQAYTRKIVVSSETYEGEKTYTAEVKDIPVKFRYSHKLQMLKIPVSKHTTDILKPIIRILPVILALYILFLSLILIQLLINLVGGSSFGINIWLKSIIFLLLSPFFVLYIVVKIFRLVWGDSGKIKWNADDYVFTDYNIFRLQLLAYSLTCIPILLLSLNLLLRLIFNSYFTEDVVINAKVLQPWSIAMDIGIILLLILHVFKYGKALKDEQDLTV